MRRNHALDIPCFGALVMLAICASAEPVKAEARFTTLIIKAYDVPVGLTFPAQQAVLLGVQDLAVRESLYFRVNPLVPDAVDREPSCLPGTDSLLFAEVRVSHFPVGKIDSVVVSVEAAKCPGGDNVVDVYLHSEVPLAGDLTSRIRITVSDAFKQLSARLRDDPHTVSELGWARN